MSADELRQAAETLRGLAQNATPAPWRHTDSEVVDDVFDAGLVVVGPEADPIALVADQWYEDADGEPTPWHDATYIATMHPGVGLALADWLDSFAALWDGGGKYVFGLTELSASASTDEREPDPTSVAGRAFALARLINGGAS